jgi:hypothetical protein
MSAHTLECVAALAVDAGSHREAARLFGAASAIRQPIGQVRFQIHQAGYKASVAALRDAMGDEELESAWARAPRSPPMKRMPTHSVVAATCRRLPRAVVAEC